MNPTGGRPSPHWSGRSPGESRSIIRSRWRTISCPRPSPGVWTASSVVAWNSTSRCTATGSCRAEGPRRPMLQTYDERNRDLIVNINGTLVHRDQAGVSPFDASVQGGDAVWEGLRLYNGRIFKLHEHLDRLERSAHALWFAEIPPREKIIEEIKRTLAANKMRDGVHIRLTLTRGMKITSGMDPRLNQRGQTLVMPDE